MSDLIVEVVDNRKKTKKSQLEINKIALQPKAIKQFSKVSTIPNKEIPILTDAEKEERVVRQLSNFDELDPKDYKNVKCGTPVKYLHAETGELYSGGILIKNVHPEYFLLKAFGSKPIMWRLYLNVGHSIFVQWVKTSEIKKLHEQYKTKLFDYFIDNIPDNADPTIIIDKLISGEFTLSIDKS